MAGALRVISVQRGHDPREFALVAFGGAGPLHANAVAELMGSFPVIVPPSPGLLCALGRPRGRLPQRVRADADPAHRRGERRRAARDPRRARRRAPRVDGRAGHPGRGPARRVRRRHALPRPGLRDPGAVGAKGSRSASTRCTSSSTASGCPTRRRRSSTCARSAPATGPQPELPEAEPRGRVARRRARYARADLQPGRAHRRPVDRHRVRLHHGRSSTATAPRSTATSTC